MGHIFNKVDIGVVIGLEVGIGLKVIPSGHSSATWCYMANASMVFTH